MTRFLFLLFFLFTLLFDSRAQCNLNVSICQQNALAGPFVFAPASNNPSTCLDFVNGQNTNNYAYIVLYITQGGVLNLLINGNNTGPGAGCLDVAIFNITNLSNPCAQLSPIHEIGCNYVLPCDGCAEFGFAIGGCPAQIPAPNVQTGDVILILVEDWSNTQNSFSLSLGNTSNSAQTGPPNATINPVAPVCSTAAPFQLIAANMGGSWSGPGVSASGVFNPAAAGIGTHTISYSLGAPPCNSASTTSISVINCAVCAFNFIQTDVSPCNGLNNTFNISGFVEFTNPPTTGTLTISDCNGNSQIFTPPFVSPINYALNNIPAGTTTNCAVTATFSTSPNCTITGLPFNYPAPCLCPADAGTFTNTIIGSSNLLNPFNLCFDDQLNIVSNGDFIPPNPSQNNIIYDPGLWLLVYDCPPTIFPQGEINDDPCLLGVASDNNGAWSIINDIGDGETFYFVPITMYSMIEDFYTSTNSLINCYDMGPVYPVTYLPQVVATQISNCAAGTVTATISGGSAAIYGSVFTAQNLQPANASFVNTTASNNGTITITGLTNGQSYSFDVIDVNGCFVTVSGVFQGAPPVQIQYPQASYCVGQPNPTPIVTGQNGGVFTASPAGLVINSATGLVNLTTSSVGVYTITYTVGPAACPSVATTTLTISNSVTPTFAQVGPFCAGTTIAALPTTSQNNISGTWSPAINNQQTTTYTFTPNANQCAVNTTMTIVINSPVTPTFAQVGPFCAGTTIAALPTTSQNNISGTWSPAINNQQTTTYTFTPGANACATSQTMTIEITPQTQPTFTQLGPFCQNATIAALPTTSNNGVTGTWSPAINNQQTTTYTFTPGANQCAASTTMTITIATEITPTFAQVGPFCIGSNIPALPTTSQNNISGTWSPAINNQQTTTYTFTPNANQCAVNTTMTIVINSPVTPTFVQVGPFCAGTTIAALPTTSQNNISGTWSPAINNQQTTTYTFTPNANQCAVNTTMTIVINSPVTPTFAQVGPFCAGTTIAALPTTSQNNISGTWSPAINNQQTTTYTFTPSVNACATSQTMTIEITPQTQPTFTQLGPFCQNATIAALPTTSNNGVTGTWSPAINNQQTTTYTFTPGANQCAASTTMTITIATEITPTFAQVGPFCIGSNIPALPTTSQNNISGTWSPAINNQQTTTYTFTPNPNQCAVVTTMTVVITNEITPTFAQVGPFCAGTTIAALPTTSQNNISGTWSPAINNQQTTTYTFTPNANQCAVNTTMTIVINSPVTPTFAQVGPFCAGTTIAALPTTSQNNISGTWSPAINNQQTTTYTFTPSVNACATSQTMTIEITPQTQPTFTQLGPFCQNATIAALPTTSNNGVTGTWSPAINNQQTTTYTFTPGANQCAASTTMTITIATEITPTFAQVGPFCIGSNIQALPTTSQNNISGTWSPAINNQQTTTYTFTPNPNQCAVVTTITVVITNEITPTFAQVGPFCAGTTIAALPTTSQNNISGTWSPAINNQQTTTYTFTPNANQCAVNTTMTIVINSPVTPTFAQVGPFCAGTTIAALPTTSQNNISGTWSPAINNQQTTTYTFTPGANACATSQTMTIEITPQTQPTFTQLGPFCQNATIAALPTTSNNGVTGTWSPAINNQQTTTYTFTPGANQCAESTTMTITIATEITPTFAQVGPFCIGSNIPALPTTSQNNISGTWSPAINNQQTTTYTFTPNPNQCAVVTTMTVVIDQPNALSIVGLNCVPGPFNWVSWNNITPNSAIGSIGTNSVTVTFTTGGMFQTASVFSGNTFPAQFNLPINSPSLAGQNTGTMTFCFDQPMLNPQVAFSSLGNNSASVQINTSVPYNIVWAGQGMNYLNNQSIIGTEGFNIIEFQGTHTCITINFLAPEFYWNIVFGGQTQNCPIDPICEGQSVNLVAQGSNNVTWSPLTNLIPISNTQVQVSPLVTTIYTITDNNACQSQASVEVQVNPNVLPIFPIFESYCAGANIPELPPTSQNNITGSWSPVLNNQQTTTYTFTPDTIFCALPTTAVIEIGSPTMSMSTMTRCEAELPFEWNGILINDSGQYQFNSIGQNGCDSLAVLNFTVVNSTSSNSSVTICEGDLPFLWNGQVINASGQYSATLIGINGCDSIATIILTVENAPSPILNASHITGCSPLTVTFQNNTFGQFSNCVWNFGNGQTTTGCDQVNATFTSAGCFDVSLTLTSSSGCAGTLTLADLICVTETPFASFFANPTVASSTNPFIQFVNTSINATSYTWNFGDESGNSNEESPFHSYPEEQGSYEVTLIAFNGNCSDTVSQLIVIESEPIFYVPNTFTPDGDLFNNTFLPIFTAGFDPYDYNLLIFNRWGEVVFESNNAKIGWDGTYGGMLCPDGTYIWQIIFSELGRDKRQLIRGHVNLLR